MKQNKGIGGMGPLGVLLSAGLVLILLAACGSSEPTYNAATGSWQGTVTDPQGQVHPATALVAPDQSFQLVLTDSGEQMVGTVDWLENYGEGDLSLVQPADRVVVAGRLKFSLETPDTLFGYLLIGSNTRWPVNLTATTAAVGSSGQAELAGTWSLGTDRLLTDIGVDAGGTISGSGAGGCGYSGKVEAPWPGWNIYRMLLFVDGCSAGNLNGTFDGLGSLSREEAGNTLGFFLADLVEKKTLDSRWYATVNQPPVAVAGADVTVTIRSGATVVLDGRGSSDPNDDSLAYGWEPLSAGVTLAGADSATPSFIPAAAGDYPFRLTVNDGLLSAQASVTLTVVFTPDRFTVNGNGTVRDNTTGLVWLQNANCLDLNAVLHNVDEGVAAAALLADGQCGLSDGSTAGDWRLPSQTELAALVDLNFANPTLSNTVGDGPWQEGDPFSGVVSDLYWTASGDPASYDVDNDWYTLYYYVNFAGGTSASSAWSNLNYIWPVRN